MNLKLVLLIWICAIGLMVFFVWFGFRDILNPRMAILRDPSYLETNPSRPIFRAIFGSLMSVFTLVAAVMATARSISRK